MTYERIRIGRLLCERGSLLVGMSGEKDNAFILGDFNAGVDPVRFIG